jgi:hypothetical protein
MSPQLPDTAANLSRDSDLRTLIIPNYFAPTAVLLRVYTRGISDDFRRG